MGKITRIFNKLEGYIKTYGLFKGIKFSLERSQKNKKELARIREELPNIENELKGELEKIKKEDLIDQNKKGEVKKNIFVFWWDGFHKAPKIVQKCFERIKELYSDYNVYGISKDNLEEFIGHNTQELEWLRAKRITIQMFADILRFKLIYKFGGIWIDSTALVVNKIDFEKYLIKYGFYSIADENTDKFLQYKNEKSTWSSFLIGGSKGVLLFKYEYELLLSYCNRHKNPPYFLLDSTLLLMKIYRLNDEILSCFNNKTFDIFYISNNLNSRKEGIDFSKMMVQKLNWRINLDKFSSKALIRRVFSYKGEST